MPLITTPRSPQDQLRTNQWSPPRLLADSIYLLAGFPIHLAAFIAVITLLAVGGATFALGVGVPLVVAGLVVAQGTAACERALQRSLLGLEAPEPLASARPTRDGIVAAMSTMLRDRQLWAYAVFALLAWVPTLVFWSVTLTWWVVVFAGLSYPGWQRYLPDGEYGDGVATCCGCPMSTGRTPCRMSSSP